MAGAGGEDRVGVHELVKRAALGALLLTLTGCGGDWILSPSRRTGSPLRIGDRVYVLMGQMRQRITYTESDTPRVAETYYYTDLWSFDVKTAAPVWRKRLRSEKDKPSARDALLGAEGDTVWVLLPEGIAAVSAKSGDLLADEAEIERRTNLKGLIPREQHYFRFGAGGLQMRAADGREWRIDPQRFTAGAVGGTSSGAVSPAYLAEDRTPAFQERGLSVAGRWVGLLTDSEMELLRDKGLVQDLNEEGRLKLWVSRVKAGTDPFRPRNYFTELTAISEEYLGAGLLSVGQQPVLTRKPDSVLVLHRDRLGRAGRLRLTRISGPAGKIVWEKALPLSVLQSVMTGEETLALWGAQYQAQSDGDRSDPLQRAHQILVTLEMASGAMRVFDVNGAATLPEAVAAARR